MIEQAIWWNALVREHLGLWQMQGWKETTGLVEVIAVAVGFVGGFVWLTYDDVKREVAAWRNR